MKNRIALAVIGLLSAVSIAQSRDEGSSANAPSPTIVLVFSEDGADNISGSCHDEGQNTLCDLTEVKIIPPDTKRVNEDVRKTLQEAKKDPDKAKHELAKIATAKVRADPNVGPKRRRILDEALAAAQAQDVKRWVHAVAERDRHTCHIWTQQYQLNFHRIGQRKWVSDAVPQGICRIVEAWEITAADENPNFLTIVVTTVSIGNPGGLLCPSTVSEVEDRRPLSTTSEKKSYEPQPSCDFIAPTLVTD
jgi:hypothetical protein